MVTKTLKRIIIAAVSQNGVIGYKNQVPWYSKEELIHFKETTTGFPIIMGRKTFEAIDKILDDRLNIIITSNPTKIRKPNLLYFSSVRNSYEYLRKNKFKQVFICGGSRIYKNTIKHAEEMIISHMNFEINGDDKFPMINPNIWKMIKEYSRNEFTVKHYVRTKMSN